MNKLLSILIFISNLCSTSIIARPGVSFTEAPMGLISDGKRLGFCGGINCTFDMTRTVGVGFGFDYNYRRCNLGWSYIGIEQIMFSYYNQFKIAETSSITPYGLLGTGFKIFLLEDFSGRDKTAWILNLGQGVVIKPASHVLIAPEVSGVIRLTPEMDFHGFFFTLGFGYIY